MAALFGSDSEEERERSAAAPGLSASEEAAARKKGFWTGSPADVSGEAAGRQGGGSGRGAAARGGRLVVSQRLSSWAVGAGVADARGGQASSGVHQLGRQAGQVGQRSLGRASSSGRQSSLPAAVRQQLAAQV